MARRKRMHPQIVAIMCANVHADRRKLEGQERTDYIRKHEDRVIGLANANRLVTRPRPKDSK